VVSVRIRRVRRQFRVEHNCGRGQIIVIASFPLRRDAEELVRQLTGHTAGR